MDSAFNSLSLGRFKWKFQEVIFNLISVIGGWDISCAIALRWMSLDLTDKSTLAQVLAWCHLATSKKPLPSMALQGHNGLTAELYLISCCVNIELCYDYIDGLMQERRNSSALAIELHLQFLALTHRYGLAPESCKSESTMHIFRYRWKMNQHTVT